MRTIATSAISGLEINFHYTFTLDPDGVKDLISENPSEAYTVSMSRINCSFYRHEDGEINLALSTFTASPIIKLSDPQTAQVDKGSFSRQHR